MPDYLKGLRGSFFLYYYYYFDNASGLKWKSVTSIKGGLRPMEPDCAYTLLVKREFCLFEWYSDIS